MSAEKTEALVIRLADFSESSRVATLFTRDFGKVSVIAKGAKRLKGPFEAALDLLTTSEVVVLRKSTSGLDILTEAKLRHRFRPPPGNLGSLYGGYYVAELLDALSEEYDAHPALYSEAQGALARLSDGARLDLTLTRFELVLLREIGQLPAFDACVACGEPVSADRPFTYKVTQGGLICSACLIEPSPRSWVSLETAAALRQLAAESATNLTSISVPPDVMQALRLILNSTIAHALGRRPKTLRYLPL